MPKIRLPGGDKLAGWARFPQWGEAWGLVRGWLIEQARASRSCRECSHRVRFFETTCPHCGAESPARIPLGALLVLAAIGILSMATVYMT